MTRRRKPLLQHALNMVGDPVAIPPIIFQPGPKCACDRNPMAMLREMLRTATTSPPHCLTDHELQRIAAKHGYHVE